jgi:hypothetical protein
MQEATAHKYFNKLSAANQQRLLKGDPHSPKVIAVRISALTEQLPGHSFNREYANWLLGLNNVSASKAQDLLAVFDALKGELPREARNLENKKIADLIEELLPLAERYGLPKLVQQQQAKWAHETGFVESDILQLQVMHMFGRIARADPHNRSSIPHLVRWLGPTCPSPMLLEDLPGAREALSFWEKRKDQHPSLEAFATLADLRDALKMNSRTLAQREGYEREALTKGEAELIERGDKWLVLRIKSKLGAQILGQGTSWCTSWGYKGDTKKSRYSGYAENLTYIRVEAAVYQAHYEKFQFMDQNDKAADFEEILSAHGGLGKAVLRSLLGQDPQAPLPLATSARRYLDCQTSKFDRSIYGHEHHVGFIFGALGEWGRPVQSTPLQAERDEVISLMPDALAYAAHHGYLHVAIKITQLALRDPAYATAFKNSLGFACIKAADAMKGNFYTHLFNKMSKNAAAATLLTEALPSVMEHLCGHGRSSHFMHLLRFAEKHPQILEQIAQNPQHVQAAIDHARGAAANRNAAHMINFCAHHERLKAALAPALLARLEAGTGKPLRKIKSKHLRYSYQHFWGNQ